MSTSIPFTRSEDQNLKGELRPLVEDPYEEAEQLGQFLGSQLCSCPKLIPRLDMLFSDEEGRIVRDTMAAWERKKLNWTRCNSK